MKKQLFQMGVTLMAGTILCGCQANLSSVKSSAGTDIVLVTGPEAVTMGKTLPVVRGGPALGKRVPTFEAVAIYPGPAMAAGVTVSKKGRVFLSFPRWADPVKNTAVELVNGELIAFPDETTNAFDATKPAEFDPAKQLVSVQSVVFDDQDRLWLLDAGSFNFAPSIHRAPKLWAYDINTRKRVKEISFPTDVALKMTYLNDVRFDLKRGAQGTAYITDSGAGGIIVVDLASGQSWRHLGMHPSVFPTPGLKATTEGQPFLQRKPTREVDSPDFRSDGIAISPDGKTLYYNPVMSHNVYAVPTDLLADRNTDQQKLNAAVKVVAQKPSGNDGIICDTSGRIYTTDFEDNSIRRIDPATGTVEVIAQDERLIWPDTLAIHGDQLYVTVNQLARQANYHFGKDMRENQYAVVRFRIPGLSVAAKN